jgi:hypothetical protein
MTYLGRARITSNLIYSNSVEVGGGAVLLGGGRFINNTVVKRRSARRQCLAFSDKTEPVVITDNIISVPQPARRLWRSRIISPNSLSTMFGITPMEITLAERTNRPERQPRRTAVR